MSLNLHKKRTDINYSEHEYTSEKLSDNIIKNTLKRKDSNVFHISFINLLDVDKCMVYGDLWNFVFNRCFVPSFEGYVSGDYWCEKLQHNSLQVAYEFSSDSTIEMLNDKINEIKEDNDIEYAGSISDMDWDEKENIFKDIDDDTVAELEFLEDAIGEAYNSESTWGEYTSFFYDNMPDHYSSEELIYGENIKFDLLGIFDAFEEMCVRESKIKK